MKDNKQDTEIESKSSQITKAYDKKLSSLSCFSLK